MTNEIVLIVLSVFLIWLLALSYYLYRFLSRSNSLSHGINKKNIDLVLESLNKELVSAKKSIHHLNSRCDTIEKDATKHIQKIGLQRFNPFKDTGGDQSFVLSLGDGSNSGIVITGLYARSGVRWYIKRFRDNKGVEHELSDEEKKALKSMI